MRPRVVFLDAGGTLFQVARPVGEVYAEVARRHGCRSDPGRLELRFRETIARAGAPAGEAGGVTPREERRWWMSVVAEVFAGEEPTRDFGTFFDELHGTFEDPAVWRVYDDVEPALASLKAAGCRLAIISNWNARLEALCEGLGVRRFFEAVIASGAAGVSKPDPRIFALALARMGAAAGDAVHVGDSLRDDIWGATRAGLGAVWLRRRTEPAGGEAASVPPADPDLARVHAEAVAARDLAEAAARVLS